MWDGDLISDAVGPPRLRRRAHRACRNRRRPVQSALALLALAIMAFAVQPHVDGLGRFADHGDVGHVESGALAHSGGEAYVARADLLSESACAICQALAAAGVAALPHAPLAIVGEHDAGVRAAIEAPTPRYTGRDWRSRAPPLRV